METLGKPQEFESGELAFSLLDPAGVVLNVVERGSGHPLQDLLPI